MLRGDRTAATVPGTGAAVCGADNGQGAAPNIHTADNAGTRNGYLKKLPRGDVHPTSRW